MAVDFTPLNSNSIANITTNFQRVDASFQDALSRSGNGPNQMNADLDMNSNDILNAGTIEAESLILNNLPVVPSDLGSFAPNSVGAAQIIDGSVGTLELADNSVTLAKMADNSVGTNELIDNSVTASKIPNGSIGTTKIVDSSVTLAKLAPEVIDFIDQQTSFKVLSDYGTIGDGVADDTAAIQSAFNALVEGDVLYVPAGTYKVDGNITLNTSAVEIFGKGFFKKDGTSGIKPMFIMNDFVDNVTWRGLRFDGAKASFAAGNGVPAILGHRNTGTLVTDCYFQNFIDVGVKLRQSMRTTVSNSKFFNMGENGCEFRWYQNDPRTAIAWVGALPSTYGDLTVTGCHFEQIGRIETASTGLVDGCGVTFDIGASALREGKTVSITGNTFIDCLRGVFCENNDSNRPFKNVSIVGNSFQRTRMPPDAYVKNGVGLINVVNFIVSGNSFINIGNYDTFSEGSYNSGVTLSSNSRDGAIIGNVFLDDSGIANRMHYCINITSAERIRIDGNNVRGALVSQINVAAGLTNISLGTNLGG